MVRNKCFILATVVLLFPSAWVHAEGNNHRGQGYVFFAPGTAIEEGIRAATTGFGGGGDLLVYNGIGVGAELEYITLWRKFAAGIGMLSVNGSYHFRRNSTVSPFVTAGYSLGFRGGHADLLNFGGGTNWWFNNSLGLRLEFRDHVHFRYNLHFVEGRIGLSFR